jgi:hypothetical protein
MLEDILPVIHALIDIVAGLKAIDANRQAELHAALEPQAEPEQETGEENMTSPPDDREPEASPTS